MGAKSRLRTGTNLTSGNGYTLDDGVLAKEFSEKKPTNAYSASFETLQ